MDKNKNGQLNPDKTGKGANQKPGTDGNKKEINPNNPTADPNKKQNGTQKDQQDLSKKKSHLQDTAK
jgi:hypothetical protein